MLKTCQVSANNEHRKPENMDYNPKLLSPQHPLWDAFVDRLDGYCDCEVLYHVVGKYEMIMQWHQDN